MANAFILSTTCLGVGDGSGRSTSCKESAPKLSRISTTFTGDSSNTQTSLNQVDSLEPRPVPDPMKAWSKRTFLPNFGSLLREDLFYLLQVIYIMPGIQADNVLNRFLAALGMDPILPPLLGRQRFEQGEISFADHAKLLD